MACKELWKLRAKAKQKAKDELKGKLRKLMNDPNANTEDVFKDSLLNDCIHYKVITGQVWPFRYFTNIFKSQPSTYIQT